MLINGVEVNRDNLQDWSVDALRKMQKTIGNNLDHNLGETDEELILMHLMTIEIKRQVKISNINLAAKKEVEQLNKEIKSGVWRSKHSKVAKPC